MKSKLWKGALTGSCLLGAMISSAAGVLGPVTPFELAPTGQNSTGKEAGDNPGLDDCNCKGAVLSEGAYNRQR